MPILSKSQILQAKDRQIQKVSVPEWGEGAEVYIRSLGGDERDRWEQWLQERRFPDEGEPDWAGIRAKLVSIGLCDQEGKELGFSELELLELGNKGKALERLFVMIRRLSGLDVTAEEELAKNLTAIPAESSG